MKRHLFRVSLIVMGGAAQALAQNPATSVSVDANANRHAINPNIYGICYGDAHDMATLNATVNRWGGNATTRYNWQIDAHSAAADWYFETYSDGSGIPGGSADGFVATTRSANNGAEPMITIPMIDYLAKLGSGRSTLAGFSVRKYGAQTGTDPWNSDAGNGVSSATGRNITGNDPLDTGVANTAAIQQSWVQHFVSTYGAAMSATGVKYYILDNEPSLWYSTHRDVHPSPATYDELFAKIVAYATAIRAADPGAKIAGPEEWSWLAMYSSGFDQSNGSGAANSDYNTHAHTYYYPWLLQQLNTYRQQTGIQLIDILTVHPYNATPGGSDDSLAAQQVRNRETRILWDPAFQDPSWYGDIGINGRILNWIPVLKAMVAQYCPGLQIGCTEYNWGDEAHLNGATTQADVLGIYGREGVDLATRWTVAKDTNTTPTTYFVTYLASQIYRNYDGSRSTFGDTSVSAAVANPDNLSAFATVRTSDGALTVMVINKQQGSTPVTVRLANFAAGGTAQAWQINSASQTAIARLGDVAVTSNTITTTVPSQSITLFVIAAGSVAPAISQQPANRTATAGNSALFTVAASGTPAPTYQWQVSIDSGSSWSDVPDSSPYSGVTTGTLIITGATTAMNGFQYRCMATNSVGSATSAVAALSVTPARPPYFDAAGYLAHNPDLQAAFGSLPDWADQAWKHYWLYGLNEGRTDGDFNPAAYLAMYPDLQATFGNDLHAAALQWYTSGRAEGRRIPAGFDARGYLARYPDLAAVFGNDLYGAWLHYLNYGVLEGRVFDTKFRAGEYPLLYGDLSALANDPREALLHWLNYGRAEGRMGRVPAGFDVPSYLSRYPDLAAVFGNLPYPQQWVAAWDHYVNYGINEGRTDGDFDPEAYLTMYGDLRAAFGDNWTLAAMHWYKYGRYEGRRIPAGFDARGYLARYPDVQLDQGDDLYGAWLHYLDWGVYEGRVYDNLFRPDEYLAMYPDLQAAFGSDRQKALLHWLYYGQYEGRLGRFP